MNARCGLIIKKRGGRVLAILVAFVMAFTMFPLSGLGSASIDAYAAEGDADPPEISRQPAQNSTYAKAATARYYVNAVSPDSGYLTYQWYRSAKYTDAVVPGNPNGTYTPEQVTSIKNAAGKVTIEENAGGKRPILSTTTPTEPGYYYYWVDVTNNSDKNKDGQVTGGEISAPLGSLLSTTKIVDRTLPPALVNGDFKYWNTLPIFTSATYSGVTKTAWRVFPANTDPLAGWYTTHVWSSSADDGKDLEYMASGSWTNIEENHPYSTIELWTGFKSTSYDETYVELGNTAPSSIYQDIATVPGKIYEWSFTHRGVNTGTERIALIIGNAINEESDYADRGIENRFDSYNGNPFPRKAGHEYTSGDYRYGMSSIPYQTSMFDDIALKLAADLNCARTAIPEGEYAVNYGNSSYYVYVSGVARDVFKPNSGSYSVPEGQGSTVFGYAAVSPIAANGNSLGKISFASGTSSTVDDSVSYSGDAKVSTNTRVGFAYTLAEVRGSSVINIQGLTAEYDSDGAGGSPAAPTSPTGGLGNGRWYTGYADSGELTFKNLTPSKTYRIIGIPAGAINEDLGTNLGAADVLDDGYYDDTTIAPASSGADGYLPSIGFTITGEGSSRKATANIENTNDAVEYALLQGASNDATTPNSEAAGIKQVWKTSVNGTVQITGLDLSRNYFLIARPSGYGEITYAQAAATTNADGDPSYIQFRTPSVATQELAVSDVARTDATTITVEATAGYEYNLADPSTGELLSITPSGSIPGTLTYSGLDANTTYQVVSKLTGEQWLTGVRVFPFADDEVGALEVNYANESIAYGPDPTDVIPTSIEYGVRKKDSDWLIGNGTTTWTAGTGTTNIDLSASTGTNILTALTPAGAGGTVVYRLKSSYAGAKVLPATELDFPARPEAPTGYSRDFAGEKIDITESGGIQWASSSSPSWSGTVGSGSSISFLAAGWSGASATTVQLRTPVGVTDFVSAGVQVTIPARPSAPTVTTINTSGSDDIEVSGLDSGKAYQSSNSNAPTWVSQLVPGGVATLTGREYEHYLRFAAIADPDGSPASYPKTVSTPINVNHVDVGSVVYGYEPPVVPVVINNVSDIENTTSGIVIVAGPDSDKFTLSSTDGVVVPGNGSSQIITISPIAGLEVDSYHATVRVTYNGDKTTTADVDFTVTKADWDVGDIELSPVVATANTLPLTITGVPNGAKLRYRAGAQAPHDTGTITGGTDSYTFSALAPESTYPLSVTVLGDDNHNESALIPLGDGNTAYATPTAANVISIDYIGERLTFKSGITPSDYLVKIGGDTIESGDSLTSYAESGNFIVDVTRKGAPYPDSITASTGTITGKTVAPASVTVNGASSAQASDGKINSTGNFEYKLASGGGLLWYSSNPVGGAYSANVMAGSYLVRTPGDANTFASKTTTAPVNIVYPVTYYTNGGTGGTPVVDTSGTETGTNKYAAGSPVTVRPNTFTRTGYNFAGWATSAGGVVAHQPAATITNIQGPVNLYAKWVRDTENTANWKTVTFEGLTGATPGPGTIPQIYVNTEEHAFDIVATWPSNPTKLGYDFLGWKNGVNPTYDIANNNAAAKEAMAAITTNATLTAQWQDDTDIDAVWKKVNFNLNAATYTQSVPATLPTIHTNSQDFASGETWPNNPTRPGFDFAGWKIGSGNTTYSPVNNSEEARDLVVVLGAPTTPITLTAQWTELPNVNITYDVASDSTGHGSVKVNTTASDTSESLPPATGAAKGATATPAAGYDFVRWTTDSAGNISGEKSTTANYVPEKNVQLLNEAADYYAVFAPRTDTVYKVEQYYQNRDTGIYETSVADTIGHTGTTDQPATATGTDLDPNAGHLTGWVYDSSHTEQASEGDEYLSDNIAGEGDLVLRVYFKAQYNITFDQGLHGTLSGGNSNVGPVDYGYDFTSDVPTIVPDTGGPVYEINSDAPWTPALPSVLTAKGAASQTYTAQYLEVGYDKVIDFDSDGGSDVTEHVYSNGLALSVDYPWPANPTKEGYIFAGWNDGTATYSAANDNAAAKAAAAEATSSFTFTAIWTDDPTVASVWKVVSFNTDGGTPAAIVSLHTNGDRFVNGETWPANPTKAGYTFTGWDDGAATYPVANNSDAAKTVAINSTANMTFTATWTDDTTDTSVWKVVTFDTGGGIPASIPALHTNGVRFATGEVWPANPTKVGFTFAGWSTTEAAAKASTTNLTVTATWTADKIAVTGVTITGGAATHAFKANDKTHIMVHAVDVQPADATVKDVLWTSSNAKIAAVNPLTGLVTFTGVEGTVTITAASTDNPLAVHSKIIKVVKNVTKIRLPLTARNLTVKKKISVVPVIDDGNKVIKAKLTYKSSNKKIATVDSKGNVKGIKKGKATITITAANGKKATVKVTVAKKAVKLKKFTIKGVKKNALSLKKGKTKDLKIVLTQKKASDLKVTFKSSKPSVLKVDKAGRITAVKKGKATVTVKVGSKTVRVKVAVKK